MGGLLFFGQRNAVVEQQVFEPPGQLFNIGHGGSLLHGGGCADDLLGLGQAQQGGLQVFVERHALRIGDGLELGANVVAHANIDIRTFARPRLHAHLDACAIAGLAEVDGSGALGPGFFQAGRQPGGRHLQRIGQPFEHGAPWRGFAVFVARKLRRGHVGVACQLGLRQTRFLAGGDESVLERLHLGLTKNSTKALKYSSNST